MKERFAFSATPMMLGHRPMWLVVLDSISNLRARRTQNSLDSSRDTLVDLDQVRLDRISWHLSQVEYYAAHRASHGGHISPCSCPLYDERSWRVADGQSTLPST